MNLFPMRYIWARTEDRQSGYSFYVSKLDHMLGLGEVFIRHGAHDPTSDSGIVVNTYRTLLLGDELHPRGGVE